ncbi:hypothetical protein [Paenibacillus sacheonensis]|uniref:Zinc-ribbon domain-containing protein n=1 Tax=Paenibacillus sacheonensis TaxID=742054 RepID=A0A7X4YUA8_9BACL|nr:hypothetical protein [Paenibacillus sacheonensis]MBM7568956.1 rubrerythrin [Paenibacillus sacheonensis]NBC72670.1 hypothetical protein [Paenibacillus sacheonensis]
MMNAIATTIVLAGAGMLVGAMIYILKLASDDSANASQLRQFVEVLFNGSSNRQEAAAAEEEEAAHRKRLAEQHGESFAEPCPACGDTVTHENAYCPSCGLRLV